MRRSKTRFLIIAAILLGAALAFASSPDAVWAGSTVYGPVMYTVTDSNYWGRAGSDSDRIPTVSYSSTKHLWYNRFGDIILTSKKLDERFTESYKYRYRGKKGTKKYVLRKNNRNNDRMSIHFTKQGKVKHIQFASEDSKGKLRKFYGKTRIKRNGKGNIVSYRDSRNRIHASVKYAYYSGNRIKAIKITTAKPKKSIYYFEFNRYGVLTKVNAKSSNHRYNCTIAYGQDKKKNITRISFRGTALRKSEGDWLRKSLSSRTIWPAYSGSDRIPRAKRNAVINSILLEDSNIYNAASYSEDCSAYIIKNIVVDGQIVPL